MEERQKWVTERRNLKGVSSPTTLLPTKTEKQLKQSYDHKLPQIDKYLFSGAHRVNKRLMAKTFYKKHDRREQIKHSNDTVWKAARLLLFKLSSAPVWLQNMASIMGIWFRLFSRF